MMQSDLSLYRNDKIGFTFWDLIGQADRSDWPAPSVVGTITVLLFLAMLRTQIKIIRWALPQHTKFSSTQLKFST